MIRLGSFLLPLLWVAWGCGTRKPVSTKTSSALDTASLNEMYYAADLNYLQGNWKQADSLFRRYIRSAMPPGPAYHRLACIASKTGKTDEAITWNSRAIQADSSVEEWLWLNAELQRKKGNYKTAGDIYAAYTLKHPRTWTCYNDAARCYAMGGEWQAMLRLCMRWEKEFGLLEPIVEYKAQALGMLNEPISAAEQWGALRRKYPDRRAYRYKQINTLKNGGAGEVAAKLLDTLMLQDPQDFELQTLYCELMSDNNASTLPPYLLKIAQNKALSFESKWKCLGNFTHAVHPAYDSCESLLRSLYEAHPKEPRVLNALGLWYLFHGNASAAARLLKQSLSEGEQTLVLWQHYLTSLSLGCEVDKMLQESDTMVELYAMIPASYQMKAIAAHTNGRMDEALLFCSQGEKFTDNVSALSALKSYIQMQSGKSVEKPQLKFYFEDSSIITDALMVNVEWALNQNNLAEAASLLNALFGKPKLLKELQFNGYNGENYWSFFQCVLQQARLALLTKENKDSAIDLLKKYLPESPVALELMGDLYGTGTSEAMGYYEKALQCTSYLHKARVQEKINNLKKR